MEFVGHAGDNMKF